MIFAELLPGGECGGFDEWRDANSSLDISAQEFADPDCPLLTQHKDWVKDTKHYSRSLFIWVKKQEKKTGLECRDTGISPVTIHRVRLKSLKHSVHVNVISVVTGNESGHDAEIERDDWLSVLRWSYLVLLSRRELRSETL